MLNLSAGQNPAICSNIIKASDSDYAGFEGFTYSLTLTRESVRGIGRMVLLGREDRLKYANLEVALREHEVEPGTTVGLIEQFYPNSRDPQVIAARRKQGNGKSLLERMMSDARGRGAGLIACWSPQSDMQRFLRRNGFEQLSRSRLFVRELPRAS